MKHFTEGLTLEMTLLQWDMSQLYPTENSFAFHLMNDTPQGVLRHASIHHTCKRENCVYPKVLARLNSSWVQALKNNPFQNTVVKRPELFLFVHIDCDICIAAFQN